jgi:hypothetical protein
MSVGIAHVAYPTRLIFSVCCSALRGKVLMTAEREGLTSQAWLAAVCFARWAGLAAGSF